MRRFADAFEGVEEGEAFPFVFARSGETGASRVPRGGGRQFININIQGVNNIEYTIYILIQIN